MNNLINWAMVVVSSLTFSLYIYSAYLGDELEKRDKELATAIADTNITVIVEVAKERIKNIDKEVNNEKPIHTSNGTYSRDF